MNKFHGKDDPEYQKVAGKLEEFLHGIREGTVLSSVGAFASEVFRDTQYEVQMPSLAAIRRTLFTS